MKKVVLITGGSGLLAINWAIAMRNRYSIILGLHHRDVQLSSTQSAQIDLENETRLIKQLQVLKPELVVHAAGLTSVEKCETEPNLAYWINVTLASNIALACHRLEIGFVHISTDHLFSGLDTLVDETHPVTPVNIYGKTKAEAELRVSEKNPLALIVRTNFYCWGTDYRHSFSDTIINTLRRKKKLTLYKDVSYSPILVETLAQATHDLVDKRANGIFNVVGNERLSKYEFGHQVAKQFSLNPEGIVVGLLADQKTLVRRPLDMSLSNQKACSVLGRQISGLNDQLERLCQQEINGQALEIQSL